MDAVSVRPGGGAVLEEEARARYLDLDFPAAIAAWERSYAAYRADGDAVGAVRMARTLAGMHGQITGDVAVMSGWLARAKTLLADCRRIRRIGLGGAEHGDVRG